MAHKIEFPDDFTWGAATASYQIEGAVNDEGRGESIWDTFCTLPGKIDHGDTGAIACDHYYRYKDDVRLMKTIGLDAYRFSIAWPRVLPQGTGAVNPAGLDFYDHLVDELLAAEIEPWATLYHWDLPQALEDAGGWPDRRTMDAFLNYADVVTRRLGDRVKRWMTFNEPWVSAFKGYGDGEHAPGRADWRDYLRAAHHQLLAHARAVPVIRQNAGALAHVGIVLNLYHIDPASDSPEDRATAHRVDGFHNRWYLDALYTGAYPADMVALYGDLMAGIDPHEMQEQLAVPGDFLGINYYFRMVVTHDETMNGPVQFRQTSPPGEYTAMDWEISPVSMYQKLMRVHRDYAPNAIYITENGAAFEDAVLNNQVHDGRRTAFYQQYLAEAQRAIAEGVPLKGFFAWSLFDNFEWARGYSKRFGIAYVDFATQRRVLKDSGKWYGQVIRQNGFTLV